MVHPQHGCLATIAARTVEDHRGKTSTLAGNVVSIISLTGVGANDWSYSTNNANFPAKIRATMNLSRRSRTLVTPLPAASPDELLKFHLARRVEVAQVADVAWKAQPTLEDMHSIEDHITADARAFYRGMTPAKLARRFYSLMWEKKDKEWLGGLEGRLQPAR
jgi:hypothetical protein